MKLQQLDLIAVGPFTQVTLDFSRGMPGLHLVFGPNEAGKSSALRAITDFFYGFPNRTSDDFLHPYKNLRVGGTLCHSDGTVHRLVRRKGNQNTLRDESDTTPVPDDLLRKYLGDVDRNSFATMFGINHESLRQGGQDLVAGGGEIGEALFASAAGLSELRSVQSGLADELQGLFKPHGPGGTLGTSIKALDAARERRKRSLVSAEAWESHRSILHNAKQRREQIVEEIQCKQAEILRCKRILRSIPLVASWKVTQSKLAAEAEVPLLHEQFGKQAQSLLLVFHQNETRIEHLQKRLQELREQIDSLPPPDERLLTLQGVDELKKGLGVHLNAQKQRPRLVSYRDDHDHKIRQLQRDIGQSVGPVDMDALRAVLSRQTRIQELGNKKEGNEERLRSKQNALKKLSLETESAESRLSQLAVSEHTIALRTTLKKIAREGNLEEDLHHLQNEVDELAVRLQAVYQTIDAPKLELVKLLSIPIPARSLVEQFEDEERAISDNLNRTLASIRELEQSKANSIQKLSLLEAGQSILSMNDLIESREFRDRGWTLIKGGLRGGDLNSSECKAFLETSPIGDSLEDAFEGALRKADDIADTLRRDADRVAAKAQLHAENQSITDRIAQQREWLTQTESERADWAKRWEGVWESCGLVPRPPRAAKVWIERVAELRKASQALEEKTRIAQKLDSQIQQFTAELIAVLARMNPDGRDKLPADWTSLVDYASGHDESARLIEREREQCESALVRGRLELAKATVDVEECQTELDHWHRDWGEEMERLRLAANASPMEASRILNALEKIREHETQRADYQKRVDGIDRDSKEFLESLERMVATAIPDCAGEAEDVQVQVLTQRIEKARSDEEDRGRLNREFVRVQGELRELQTSHDATKRSIHGMMMEAKVQSPEELLGAAERSNEKRSSLSSIRTIESAIQGECGLGDLNEFLAEVEREASEKDSIEPRIQQLASEVALLESDKERSLEEFHRENSVLEQLERQEEVLDATVDCESLAATIEEQFRELMVLRICSHVLNAGMERFREKNQGPVLKAAGDMFQKMTLGGFERLRVDWDENGKAVMVGVRGGTAEDLHVHQMSDGTCDQLYLSLRLACLENWLSHHEPIPFIVDDILVHFDDDRSVATLQRLADLSARTQVIFFTHHEHLLELARKALPADQLHIHYLRS
ncbi:AAA family ATPase [Pirellulaceae bacterium SH501]